MARMVSLPLALLTLGIAFPAFPQGPAPDRAEMEQRIMSRSLVSMGEVARLQRVLARAREGKPVVVGVIGGSITAGAGASNGEKAYGSLVAGWWRQAFPQSKVEFVNAGVGATGSAYGALRYRRDLGARKPDFVLVEFAVNDPPDQGAAESYEGLLRQILSERQRPAVMLVFTMNNAGANAQDWQSKLGAHYGLPMVSFRDALWPEISAGTLRWEEVEADEVHPNDRGHAYIARFVTAVLERVLADLPKHFRAPALARLPAPLLTDAFQHVTLFEGKALVPVSNHGWTLKEASPWETGWESETPGSTLEFQVSGRIVLVMDYHLHGPMGKAAWQVDDRSPVVVDGWFEPTWGGWRNMHVLARDLPPGKHRVRVTLLAERNPASGGHRFLVCALGVAGVKASR